MTRPTAYEMFALLFLYIVMQLFAAWSVSIIVSATPSVVVSTGPKALFTEVGMVYPECDFAHVLIQLPIRELLNRTDYVYSVFEARMRKNISSSEVRWVPAWRELQLQNLLGRKAARVFHMRDTVLVEFQTPPVDEGSRSTREVNVNIDPVNIINAVFSGLNNWFHATSIADLRSQLGVVAHEVEGLQAATHVLSANQLQIAQTLELFINETEFLYDTTHIDLLLWLSLDELETALSAIITASGRFSDGSIPAWLLPPTEAQVTLQAVNAYALKNEQTAAVSSPMDLHHVPTTVVSSSDAWVIVLHVPVVSPQYALKAFEFTNAPFLVDNASVQFDVGSGLVGHSQDLWPDLRTVFIPQADEGTACLRYNVSRICPSTPVSRTPPCPVALLYGRSDGCSLVPAKSPFISVGAGGPTLIFTEDPLEIVLKCGDDVFFDTYQGLNIFNVSEGCRLESSDFSLYVPGTVRGYDLVFHALAIPVDVLVENSDINIHDLGVARHQDFLVQLRQLQPVISKLETRTSGFSHDGWRTPNIITIVIGSLAFLGVVLMAGTCLYAARTTYTAVAGDACAAGVLAPRGMHSFVRTLFGWHDQVDVPPRVSSLSLVGSRPHISVSLNGILVTALVDTGATVSLLHAKFRERMSVAPCQLSGPTPIRDANTGSATSVGGFAVTVQGVHLDTTAHFHVMTNLSSDAIVGADFLSLHQCRIDFQANTISFHGLSEPVTADIEPVVQHVVWRTPTVVHAMFGFLVIGGIVLLTGASLLAGGSARPLVAGPA